MLNSTWHYFIHVRWLPSRDGPGPSGFLLWGFTALGLFSGPLAPMPPIEIERPIPPSQEGLRLDQFEIEIDQNSLDCSAGELASGIRAPFLYRPESEAYQGELQLHAARCNMRF